MLTIATESSTCRQCGVEIEKGEHISWANGPYHLACTPIPLDWENAKASNFFRQPPSDEPKGKTWSKSDFIAVLLATVVAVFVLILAMLPGNTYGYFIFLRWVVCAVLILFILLFLNRDLISWAYGFGFLAVLYNPILRVHLTRDIWVVLNIATIIAFLVGFSILWACERRVAKKLMKR